MKRLIARLLIYGLAALLLAGTGMLAWQLREQRLTFYTDADSIREPEQLVQVRDILWQRAQELGQSVNSLDAEHGPKVSGDETTLFFVRGRPSRNADIYYSFRTGRGWSDPQPLVEVNTEADELGPAPSFDGRSLYFHSDREGGSGGYDLWVVHREDDGWGEPINLGPEVNSRYNDYGAAVSPEGDTLYFASNRPSPYDLSRPPDDASPTVIAEDSRRRAYDLYQSAITDEGIRPALPIAELNTAFNEGSPSVSPQGDFLYFSSDDPRGEGGFDLYRSRRLRGDHEPAENLGPMVNSSADELDPSTSLGGFELLFSSNRPTDEINDVGRADFNIFFARSREVFRETETFRASIDWAAIAAALGPLLLWLVLALLLVLALMKMKQSRLRSLTLLARCILGSLLIHMLIMAMLTAWKVRSTLAGIIKEGGATKVALVSPSVGQRLASQVRGGLTDVAVDLNSARSERQETPTEVEPVNAEASVPVEAVAIEQQAVHDAMESVTEATVQPTRVPQSVQVAQLQQTSDVSVEIPVQPTPVQAAEAVLSAPSVAPSAARAADATPRPVVPTDAAIAFTMQATDLQAHQSNVQTMLPAAEASDASASATALRPRFVESDAAETDSPADVEVAAVPAPPTERSTEAQTTIAAQASNVVRQDSTPDPQLQTTGATVVAMAPPTPVEAVDQTPMVSSSSAAASSESESPLALRQSLPVSVEPSAAPTVALPMVQAAAGPSNSAVEDAVSFVPSDAMTSTRGAVEIEAADPFVPVDMSPAEISDGAATSMLAALALPAMESEVEDSWSEPMESHDGPLVQGIDPNLPHLEEATAAADPGSVGLPMDVAPESERVELEDLALIIDDEPGFGPLPHQDLDQAMLVVDQRFADLEQPSLDSTDEQSVDVPPLDLQAADTFDFVAMDLSLPQPEIPRNDPFAQRAPEIRQQVLEERGGTRETEQAVEMALRWLARHQSRDGHWDGKHFDDYCDNCQGGASTVDAGVALTGLSLLCFFAADHSHVREGPYREVVTRGLVWLLAQQEPDGSLIGNESMYSHGIATIALAEAYGMSGDERLAAPVTAAADFIYDARNRNFGGWRYEPGQVGDTSVMGWQVMALSAAKRAGVEVPDEAFDVARRWLQKVRDPWKQGLYSYQPKRKVTPSMTAEAMFVNQLLGVDRDEEHMGMSADYIVEVLPDWKRDNNTYFWYYATLALFQHGDEHWDRWNEVIKQELVEHQSTSGPAAGSWSPLGKWANVGGRVYQTAICTLILEVYYRYLPLYMQRK